MITNRVVDFPSLSDEINVEGELLKRKMIKFKIFNVIIVIVYLQCFHAFSMIVFERKSVQAS